MAVANAVTGSAAASREAARQRAISSPFASRDRLVAKFRREVYRANGVVWLPHQADWQLAAEGWSLLPVPYRGEPGARWTEVLLPSTELRPGEDPIKRLRVNNVECAVTRRVITPRVGGVAHILGDLAGYKGGKSYGGALWLAGFAIVRGLVQLVGFEYSTSEPEFEYLSEFLLSERGMGMKAVRYLNDRRQGRMLMELPTGAVFEVKSWERKDSLKGKRVLAYYYAEAYQLPGLECFTQFSQNLRELHGFACFTTTPDRPWVGEIHDQGHGKDPDWHCTCEVDASCNPWTFDQRARDRDDPEKGGIMTRERFAIAWQGKLGRFIGRVYDVARGQRTFSPLTHPMIWREDLVRAMVPDGEGTASSDA